MRRQSKKRAKTEAPYRIKRRLYLKNHPVCMTGCGSLAQCVHEIARGSHRHLAYKEPCAWLAVCYACNAGPMNNAEIWPLARQLALKYERDRDNYDLDKFNEIRAGAARKLFWSDIEPYLDT